ncbi:MAG: tyrosine-protein phosphatase [Chloroflexi bacterium]|nr:tyrosine-protein phosphatase [Chloroflexota bacterium]
METRIRLIPFSSVPYFCDLGGYRATDRRTVRWRRIYRSSTVHTMSDEEAERARNELNIAAIFDLRTREDVERDGAGPLVAPPVKHHHVPLLASLPDPVPAGVVRTTTDMVGVYLRMVSEGASSIARALVAMAELEGRPALFHCSAGKDRTGFFAAILLGTLGVQAQDIVYDYTLTERSAEIMHAVLNHVRQEHGGPREYVLAQGVSLDTIARLEESLLE